MSRRFSRFFLAAVLSFSMAAMLTVSYEAEARRAGGGMSMGRQSSNITQQRAPVTPPAANHAARSSSAAAPAAGAAAAGTAARSGMSRFLGPLAGIAAGLGIAALLSHLGLSGAFLEMISSMLLIGLLVFAVMFLVRRFRSAGARPATQQAGAQPMMRHNSSWSRPEQPAAAPLASAAAAPVSATPAAPVDESWFIPDDFDTPTFLGNAKQQFIEVQKLWDLGHVEQLRNFLTDDLLNEAIPQIEQRAGQGSTEVVLLNAELLGIEKVADGHLASVRYSGMLREDPQTEAFRFEEIWNLFKADGSGWLLAGIQQIPLEYEE